MEEEGISKEEFSRDQLTNILLRLDITQESIVGASLYFLKYSQEGESVALVEEWQNSFDQYERAEVQNKRLILIYLANDVLQRSKALPIYPVISEAFARILPQCINKLCLVAPDKIKLEVIKVLNIWKDRKVYKKEFIRDLRHKLEEQPNREGGSSAAAVGQDTQDDQLPDDFMQPPTELINLATIAKEVVNWEEKGEKALEQLQNLKLNIHSDAFDEAEFQLKLDEYKKCLERLGSYRINLLKAINDTLKTSDVNHMKYVLAFKKIEDIHNRIKRIEEHTR